MVTLCPEVKFEKLAIHGEVSMGREKYWFNVASQKLPGGPEFSPRESKTNLVAKLIDGKKSIITGEDRDLLLRKIISALKK